MQTVTKTEMTRDTVITGAEFRDFYKNHWPREFYIDDCGVDFEDERGDYILPDDARHPIGDFGVAVWQGKTGETWAGRSFQDHEMIELHEVYAEVMGKTQKQVLVAFRIDPEKAEDFVAAAKEMGATLI